jgi:hypothetical protein
MHLVSLTQSRVIRSPHKRLLRPFFLWLDFVYLSLYPLPQSVGSKVEAWPCLVSDGQSPAFYCGDPCSLPGQVMNNLWLTKWHWGRASSSTLVSHFLFHQMFHVYLPSSFWARTVGRRVASVPSGPSFNPPWKEIMYKLRFCLICTDTKFCVVQDIYRFSTASRPTLWPSHSLLSIENSGKTAGAWS